MDHTGIDVHKRESQIYSLVQGGEVVEQRIRTEGERFAAVLGARLRAPDPDRGLDRHPPQAEELRTWALRIAARRGKQVAVVALARRLAGILSALLPDGSVFQPQRVRPPRPPAATLVNV